MTNYDKYIKGNDELIKRLLSDECLAFNIKTNKALCCVDCDCNNCLFSTLNDGDKYGDDCRERAAAWLDEEYQEFGIGDLVRITNTGGIYQGYIDWIRTNVPNVEDRSKYMFSVSLSELYGGKTQNMQFEIVAIGKHLNNNNKTLCYIKDNCGRCFLIESDAIVHYYAKKEGVTNEIN